MATLRSSLLAAAGWCLVSGLLHAQNAEGPAEENSVKVELLEAGAAPRETIRLQPMKGTTETVEMTMKLDQSMTMNGNKLPRVDMPDQKWTIDFTIGEISPDGDIQFDFQYKSIDLVKDPANPSPLAPILEKMLAPLAGASGSGVVTDRGLTKKADFTIPPGVAPQLRTILDGMRDSMQRLSSPVPAEPIGIGGKWRVTQVIKSNGIRLTQVTVHELTQVDGPRYTVGIKLTQSAEPQTISPPGLPPGAKIQLDALDSKGEGTMVINSKSIVPAESKLQLTSNTKMDIDIGGQKQAMSTEMKLEMTFSPVANSDQDSER
ncbi:MAG TPA: hypothetical protein VMM76_18080 [Pirellulaceae bacterium]|nr:hypothetical protein [Pirellulaceae bacterium]